MFGDEIGSCRQFEAANDISSAEFLRRYENDELPESLDYAEWIGEYRILTRLREKANAYRETQYMDAIQHTGGQTATIRLGCVIPIRNDVSDRDSG